MKEKLAERIRMTRLMKGLSQQNMADELGITVASYSNIERGVTDITVTRLFAISKILDVTASGLIDESIYIKKDISNEPFGNYQNSTTIQLLEISQQLNHQQKEIERLTNELIKLKK